ncbi:Pentatricopeptide repeat-containing protein [Zostera marina]|uniref:Pentatricopeptide repeat-containing protein n=1 Tax=Zostera marina TaxID=29655 RepID=A0A0K9Q3N0_ZOSMR|nr:Pentatricopeptide repeat-containing protein [Zostera marina]
MSSDMDSLLHGLLVMSPSFKIQISLLTGVLDSTTTFRQLKQAHAQIVRHNLHHCNVLITKLLGRLIDQKIPMYPYPHRIFSQVRHPNHFLWTSLIRGYSLLHSHHTTAFSLYYQMKLHLHPSSFTPPLNFNINFIFSTLLKLAATVCSLSAGSQLHGQMIFTGGCDSNVFLNDTLIDMYVSCSQLHCARKVFDEMVDRDVVSWTIMVVGYCRVGEMAMAKELFQKVPVKDSVAWTAMITGFAQNGRPKDALRLFERMIEGGNISCVSEVTLPSVISSCGQLGAVEPARRLAELVEATGFSENIMVGSALIDMFGKCGLVNDALRVFDKMQNKNIYTYSTTIAVLGVHGRVHDAIRLFENMCEISDANPNEVTFVGVLTACSRGGLVEQGRHYFQQMTKKYRIVPNLNHYGCMVDLLGRAGLVEEAYEVVRSMPMKPHGGIWGALLSACKVHDGYIGIAEIAARQLFKLEPFGIGNYVVLSNIYASAGMWEKVVKLRKTMRWKDFKKEPARSLIEI